MQEPRWVSKRAALALHQEQIVEHGGSAGIRDEALLDSALALNVFAYDKAANLFRLAASYAFGVARNHVFVDANKRIALVVSILFLNLNGWDVEASKAEVYETFLALADGEVTEEQMAGWFGRWAIPLI